MPRSDLTEIVVVLDKSGSMEAVRSDAIGGFNSFLHDQQALLGDARLTLVLFDSPGNYKVVHDGVPIQEVPPLDAATYVPDGMTALLDAIGRTIDQVGARLHQTPEEQRPEKVIMAILTDGEENSSSDYTRAQVFDRVRHQSEVYQWEFVFLGANQDAIGEATSMGLQVHQAMNFQATPEDVGRVFAAASDAVSRVRRSGTIDGWKAAPGDDDEGDA